MPFQIIRNDLTRVRADAIVNTANPRPIVGRGTDGAVYAAAGEAELLRARQALGDIAPGQAASTPAFRLRARYIIHTVGPVWQDGSHGEREILRSCYRESLRLAAELGCESAAFPLIAAGVYGFPRDQALTIALEEIGRFLLTHDMLVTLVVFDGKALELSRSLVGDVEEYISEREARDLRRTEQRLGMQTVRRRQPPEADRAGAAGAPPAPGPKYAMPEAAAASPAREKMLPSAAGRSLEELLDRREDSFQQRLFHLIDERGLDDVTVYKRANIDRKVFSSIRCKPHYRPKKRTAVAFAIALQLDMEDARDLLARAELAFSPSSRFDLIVTYFITNHIYDIYALNAALFKYGEPTLGE